MTYGKDHTAPHAVTAELSCLYAACPRWGQSPKLPGRRLLRKCFQHELHRPRRYQPRGVCCITRLESRHVVRSYNIEAHIRHAIRSGHSGSELPRHRVFRLASNHHGGAGQGRPRFVADLHIAVIRAVARPRTPRLLPQPAERILAPLRTLRSPPQILLPPEQIRCLRLRLAVGDTVLDRPIVLGPVNGTQMIRAGQDDGIGEPARARPDECDAARVTANTINPAQML